MWRDRSTRYNAASTGGKETVTLKTIRMTLLAMAGVHRSQRRKAAGSQFENLPPTSVTKQYSGNRSRHLFCFSRSADRQNTQPGGCETLVLLVLEWAEEPTRQGRRGPRHRS